MDVDLRGIVADRAAIEHIEVRLPEGVTRFTMRHFDLVSGFVLDGEDDFRIDPDAADGDISYTWYGEAGDRQLGIAVYHGLMSATQTGPGGSYGLAYVAGELRWRHIDPRRMPRPIEQPGPRAPQPVDKHIAAPLARPKYGLNTVDVLVLNTANARTVAGGRAQLDATVFGAMEQVSVALRTSGMDDVRVRNVLQSGDLSVEVNYNEVPGNTCAGPDVDLCRWVGHRMWLRTSATVASLRDTHGADLVVMLVGDDQGYAGVAYVQRVGCGELEFYEESPGCSTGLGYAPFAFSVIDVGLATEYQVFAHELGHQFGMEHQQSANVTPSYPWSFAQTRSDWLVETVVGGQSLDRSLQFSNPNVPFVGTSEPSGEALRFNARSASCLARAMAGFRIPGALETFYSDGFEVRLIPPEGC